ncbi:helix-turn-helix domain-containing protein [Paenibacillus dokdonensis]|uniref:helix-turn-helix domain-containing protein n=1 Tax=Paenibacillus dokdonensis TaxID=2567944 RepID=UPI0010A8CFC6
MCCFSLQDLRQVEKTTKKTFRLLFHLLTIADSRKFVSISQKDIAEAIEMDRTSVSLALKDIKNHGIIQSPRT